MWIYDRLEKTRFVKFFRTWYQDSSSGCHSQLQFLHRTSQNLGLQVMPHLRSLTYAGGPSRGSPVPWDINYLGSHPN